MPVGEAPQLRHLVAQVELERRLEQAQVGSEGFTRQVGTLVKLVRVLMLGPVVVAFSLIAPRLPAEDGGAAPRKGGKLGFTKLVPWFILGFLVLASLRSLGLIPDAAVKPLTQLAGFLTVLSMAALGLGVDVRVLARVGGRVTLAVTGSLVVLIGISLALIRLLGIA